MENKSLRKLIIDGLMIAIVFLATYFTKFPSPLPNGYINLGDAVIIVAALLFGKRNALIAGAIGSAFSDFALGYLIYVPVTFIVKGLEGYIMGLIAEKIGNKKVSQVVSIVVGMCIMVFGYFIAEASVLGMIDSNLGLSAAIINLPFNVVQGLASGILGFALVYMMAKNKAISYQ